MIAGRYTLERELGRGGMGAVWLGRDSLLGRPVALKRVGAGLGAAGSDLDRAEREARLAARLNHPHVVAVYDFVEVGDERWLVMEYVEGLTLAELVRRDGPLPADRAAPIIRQAASALAVAHAAGIVHRDVKPSNILVGVGGQVKLSDFGIARGQTDVSLTQTGLVTGSPAYLAPEVASGQGATAASDLWSLGATLFHALAGRPPYDVGDNVLGALYRVVNDDPPRLSDAGWLDPPLRATMAVDPGRRWTSAQVRDYLAAGPPTRPATATVPTAAALAPPPLTPAQPPARPPTEPTSEPPPRERRSGVLAGLTVAALVLAAVLGGWLLLRGDGEETAGTQTQGGSPTEDATPSGSSGKSPSGSADSSSPDDAAVTSAGMEDFVEDYLATVTTDPRAAWSRLTPQFQQQSGGYAAYRRFWRGFRSAEMTSANANPDTLQIAYTVDYVHRDGTTSADVVTLQLEGTDGDYLIAGER